MSKLLNAITGLLAFAVFLAIIAQAHSAPLPQPRPVPIWHEIVPVPHQDPIGDLIASLEAGT